MPYIPEDRRTWCRDNCFGLGVENAGELNYVITMIIKAYTKNPSYQKYNDCVGALEGAKLELYRREIAPYEDEKIRINGDV